MSKVENESKRTVVKAALKVVDLAGLQVDPSYQRDVKAKHKSIVAEFNEEALGIPLVGERGDGSRWIVDGLQRITALRKMGRKSVRAEVFASDGPEHEAAIFKLVNLNRTKLSPGEEFRALLAGQDKLAWAIKEAVEAEGYRIVLGRRGQKLGGDNTYAAKELTCINTLVAVAKRSGTAPIRFALVAIRESWPGDRLGPYNMMIDGLSIFYSRHQGVVDMDRLIPRLRTVTPHKLIYAAQQVSLGGSGRSNAIADLIEKTYRKRLSGRAGS